jgi:hypothetical protein
MDPVSGIVGIASGTVTLACLAIKISKTLSTMVSMHHHSEALVYALIGACKAIETALNRIKVWIESQTSIEYQENSIFFDQLAASIEAGKIVLGALQEDVEVPATSKTWQTVSAIFKTVLKEDVLRDHCMRLNLQLSSLQLLLATTNMSVLSMCSCTDLGR